MGPHKIILGATPAIGFWRPQFAQVALPGPKGWFLGPPWVRFLGGPFFSDASSNSHLFFPLGPIPWCPSLRDCWGWGPFSILGFEKVSFRWPLLVRLVGPQFWLDVSAKTAVLLYRWLSFQGCFGDLEWLRGRDPESSSGSLCSDEGPIGGPDLTLQGAKSVYRSRRLKKRCLPTDAPREASKLHLLATGGPARETFASGGPGPRDPWIPSGIDFRRTSQLKRSIFIKNC